MRVICVLLCLFSLQVTQSTAGEHDPLAGLRGPEKLRVLIDTVVEHQRALKSLRAHFRQEKSSSLLLKPVIAEGEFLFQAPESVRWNYESPEKMVVCFSGSTLVTFRPEEKELDELEISRKNRRFLKVLAGTLPLDELKSQFEISLKDSGLPEAYRLGLVPTHHSLARKLKSLELEIDRKLFLPVRLRSEEADGDVTLFVFTKLELDPKLDPALFDIPREGLRVRRLKAPR